MITICGPSSLRTWRPADRITNTRVLHCSRRRDADVGRARAIPKAAKVLRRRRPAPVPVGRVSAGSRTMAHYNIRTRRLIHAAAHKHTRI